MTWPGQFNFDFFGFLILSATWTAWRNQFSALGVRACARGAVWRHPVFDNLPSMPQLSDEGRYPCDAAR